MNAVSTFRPVFLLLTIFTCVFLSACQDETLRTSTYHTKVPVFLSVAEVRAQPIAVQSPEILSVPGKIYVYGDYLFVNEVGKGIHVINNTDPSSPKFINFITIPGNIDIAVNDDILYADHYVDLIAFDISNPANITEVKRVEDVFDELYTNQLKNLIVSYKDTVITYVSNVEEKGDLFYNNLANSSSNGSGSSYGTGGSTARFTLMNSFLYTVSNSHLKLFDVSQARNPQYLNKINIGWGIETIFPYENNLFIGSTNGMHIFSATNPAAPVRLSTYQHVTSCDPVVVQGKYAYVTLRSGNFCQQGVNLLEVLNIENLSQPVLVKSFPMQNPHGLSVSNSNLFICEGTYGLKAFDKSDVLSIAQKQLSFKKNIDARDVIAGPKSLIVTGLKGVYQYDYSNPSSLKLLSHLSLSPAL